MPGRKPDPDKRAHILRAATEVFSTREFHAVPVEEVAVAAGVGKGTLYLYFPTKEHLFYATILEAMDVLLAELRAAVDARAGEDGLRAFAACMLEFFRQRRQLAVLMHRYEHRLLEPEGAEWRARRAELVAIVRPLILSVALVPRDAPFASEMLLALIRAAVLNHGDRESSAHVAEMVVRVFLHGAAATDGTRAKPAQIRAKGSARAAGGRR